MLNYTTYAEDAGLLQKLSVLATFENLVAVIATLIIVTSSLIVKNIYKKTNRTRADFMFMLLSISDIGVGVLSMPAIGIRAPFAYQIREYYNHGSRAPLIISYFFVDFPYTFSNILTAVIAIDGLLIITLNNCYKHIITEKRLKIIVAFLLFINIGYLCLEIYYMLPERCCDTHSSLYGGFVAILTVPMIAAILAYMCIILTVRKSSKRVSLLGKLCNRKRDRTLFETIFYICICQVTCAVPYLIVLSLSAAYYDSAERYNDIGPWLVILRNCQCFCNGFILLHNQKRNAKK